jgi:hypothetical protein
MQARGQDVPSVQSGRHRMDGPQNGALRPSASKSAVFHKISRWNDFILFAIATELNAPDARQGTATIEAHQVTINQARSDETDKQRALGCNTKKIPIAFSN